MTPIKTGAVIHLAEWDSYCHADVYQIHDVYIFVCGSEYRDPAMHAYLGVHAQVRVGNYFDKQYRYRILAVPASHVAQLTPWHKERRSGGA